jgi:16S rRNA (guanine527-N7)-methyltransferase
LDTARIAALLDPYLEQSLPTSQLDQISTYIDLLLRWNARINLTAIRRPEEIVTRHFGESFFLARHVFPDG